MRRFKSKALKHLVATDVGRAASTSRTCRTSFIYSTPTRRPVNPPGGRTGRIGKTGRVISLVSPSIS